MSSETLVALGAFFVAFLCASIGTAALLQKIGDAYNEWRDRRVVAQVKRESERYHGYSTPLKPTGKPFDGMPMPKPPARTLGRTDTSGPLIHASTCESVSLAWLAKDDEGRR